MMAKRCIKCKKWMANRHIGNICTDCKGVFNPPPKPLNEKEKI